MKVSEWLNAVQAACRLLFPGKPFRQEVTRGTRIKARIEIGLDMFADLFFREETGRIDYALIVRGQRQYGLDNLGGWHEHPLGDPDSHVPIEMPSPEEALYRLYAAVGHFSDDQRSWIRPLIAAAGPGPVNPTPPKKASKA